MRKFADVRLEFDGKTYTILANRLLPLIARLEGIVTFVELIQIQARGGVPQAKLAMAYAEALRYAGANVEDDEVYYRMFPATKAGEQYSGGAVAAAVTGIMALMLPPEHIAKTADNVGNASTPASASGASSRKPTKRR